MTITPPESTEQLLTPAEVAEQWQTSSRQVLRACRAGLLPFVQLGPRTIRILRADARRVLTERRIVGPTGAAPEKSDA